MAQHGMACMHACHGMAWATSTLLRQMGMPTSTFLKGLGYDIILYHTIYYIMSHFFNVLQYISFLAGYQKLSKKDQKGPAPPKNQKRCTEILPTGGQMRRTMTTS